ncbi:MAG: biopolymer transporter ExbD [Bryobacterales bacterium]|nr:biopolymer transporter ExbD [Bryobacterales bacterium]
MAFSFNGGGMGRGRSRGLTSLAEMNVVPLVDVVLVLLIIFMLTSSVMEFGLEVQVPKVKQVRETAQDLPVVTLTRDGEISLNEKPVNINSLGDTIKQRFNGATGAFVRADKNTTWDVLAQVVSALGQAHIEVKMVTRPVDTSERSSR